LNQNAAYSNYYRIDIPNAQVGHVYIKLNTTSENAYLYGESLFAPSNDEYYSCSEDDPSIDPVSGNYIYSFFCYTPREGPFYILLTDAEAFNANLTIDILQCPTNMGGYNCSYPVYQFLPNSTFSFYTPSEFQVAALSYPFTYFYFDIPTGFVFGEIVVNAFSPQDDSTWYFRRNGYPETSSSYGYESENEVRDVSYPDELEDGFGLTQFDWAVPGRVYFGFSCDNEYGCNVTLSANVSSVPVGSTTNGLSTGGLTTKGVSTGTTTKGISTGAISTGTTTKGLSTGAITTRGVTTHVGITTNSAVTTAAANSPASTLVPSVFVALIAAVFFF